MPTGREEYDAATGRYKAVKHWMQSKVRALAQGMAAMLGFPTLIYVRAVQADVWLACKRQSPLLPARCTHWAAGGGGD